MEQNSFIEIPATTLSAIKKKLFSSKNGVDLSHIVSDLATNQNRDLVAINVALTFEGFKPDIDSRPRYERRYKSLIELTFVNYSLILNIVTFKRQAISKLDDEIGFMFSTPNEEVFTETCSLTDWLNKTTDRKELITRIRELYSKKKD